MKGIRSSIRTSSKAPKLKLRPPKPPGPRMGAPLVAVAALVGAADAATVFHHDDEGLCFSFREQIIHDQIGMTLIAPAGFIFSHAMLQIEHRVSRIGILVIVRRSIDKATAD